MLCRARWHSTSIYNTRLLEVTYSPRLFPSPSHLSPGSDFSCKAPPICPPSPHHVTVAHKQSGKSRTRIMSQRERVFPLPCPLPSASHLASRTGQGGLLLLLSCPGPCLTVFSTQNTKSIYNKGTGRYQNLIYEKYCLTFHLNNEWREY